MPTYLYNCSDCKITFEHFCYMADYTGKTVCPTCNKETEEREYTVPLSGFVKLADSEIKTIGHLAERNREKMSDDQRAALHRKHNEYKDTPSTKPLPKGMTRMK